MRSETSSRFAALQRIFWLNATRYCGNPSSDEPFDVAGGLRADSPSSTGQTDLLGRREMGSAQETDPMKKSIDHLWLVLNRPPTFGLVMIEAMACVTPTVAYRNGSVSEVLEENKTGFIINNLQDAVQAVKCIPFLRRCTHSRESVDCVSQLRRIYRLGQRLNKP
jgi:hypothetical protein